MTFLYEHISTKDQLIEFVEHLNTLTVREKHLLFVEVFQPRIFDFMADKFPRRNQVYFEKWWFAVRTFPVYATIKVNKKLPIEKPELKSGFFEEIYFHINPEDNSGISQVAS